MSYVVTEYLTTNNASIRSPFSFTCLISRGIATSNVDFCAMECFNKNQTISKIRASWFDQLSYVSAQISKDRNEL